ncbi:MAG: hypothetical protein ACRD1E_06925, partial [Terriglobales bacterium]
MSDHIRLSFWFSAQPATQVLPRLAQAAEQLPAEAQQRGVRLLSVVAFDWQQAALLEEEYETGIAFEAALEAMREFLQPDCACRVEMAWLLWRYQEGIWTQAPHSIQLASLGPDFGREERAIEDEGQVVVDFGLDEVFLAERAPWNVETRRHLQANILQLLAYCHKAQQQLQPKKRLLWSEDED